LFGKFRNDGGVVVSNECRIVLQAINAERVDFGRLVARTLVCGIDAEITEIWQ